MGALFGAFFREKGRLIAALAVHQTLERPPGGVVLDPFLGSGTTALVARRLGRHYIGIEPNPEYVAIVRSRLEREPEPSKQ